MKSKFNTSTMKVLYYACSNMKDYINGHSKKLLQDANDNDALNLACNCTRMVCPCSGADRGSNCKTSDVVYKATIKDDLNVEKTYTGSTEQELKRGFHSMAHV